MKKRKKKKSRCALREAIVSKDHIPAVYERMKGPLIGLFIKKGGRVDEAEDFLHGVFIKLLNAIKSGAQIRVGGVFGYTMRIGQNSLVDLYRAQKSGRSSIVDEFLGDKVEEIADEAPEIPDPAHDLRMLLYRVLGDSRLPLNKRIAFAMKWHNNFTHVAIANAFGISRNTVTQWLQDVIKHVEEVNKTKETINQGR